MEHSSTRRSKPRRALRTGNVVIAERMLSGRIYDKETREPVPEVGLIKNFRTDDGGGGLGIVPVKADGPFALDAVEPGDYTFKATAQNYMPVTVQVHVNASDSAQTIDIPLERGIAVVVSIVSPAGDPLAGATVIDGVGGGRCSMLNLRTGRFSVPAVPDPSG